MKLERHLKAFFDEVLKEVKTNPAFAERISVALSDGSSITSKRKGNKRRAPAVLDPVKILEETGEDQLRSRLTELNIEQLKDIVSEYGMDQAKLVMKWTTAKRIIDHIISTA